MTMDAKYFCSISCIFTFSRYFTFDISHLKKIIRICFSQNKSALAFSLYDAMYLQYIDPDEKVVKLSGMCILVLEQTIFLTMAPLDLLLFSTASKTYGRIYHACLCTCPRNHTSG